MVISKETYSHWLNNPHTIGLEDIKQLKELIDLYPFCQTSRIFQLKALQNVKSINYNQNLKEAAAYVGDRQRLFYLLTEKNTPKAKITNQKVEDRNSQKVIPQQKVVEEKLQLGQPFEFNQEETHSFNEWLKLSQAKPIRRPKESKNKLHKKINLIEDFIANRNREPKKEFYSASDKAKESVKFHFDIVTETLAKVYLEQGHYEKAKAAYQHLCLKYPQKSSLFASQIELIDQLITKNK